MKTAIMKIEDIKPAEYNPRVELKPGDAEYDALDNSIGKFGTAVPLIVNERTGNLISGHQRLNVLKANGAEETEVVLTDMDEQQEKLCNIALNKIEGDWDYLKLQELFDEITADGMDDLKYTGFTESEIDELYETGEIDFDDMDDELTDPGQYGGGEYGDSEDKGEPEFSVYLIFKTKQAAEKWLEEKGVDERFGDMSRNVMIRMEGIEYGTGY